MEEKWFEKVARTRAPDFVVKGDRDNPYMERWWIIQRNRAANIYLHRFWRSDTDEALHDHPWPNVSYLLKGRYIEHTVKGARLALPGSLKVRMAHTPHRIEIEPGYEGKVWSLFITGPVIRTWGFHCPKGWRSWKEYSREREKGIRGLGCD